MVRQRFGIHRLHHALGNLLLLLWWLAFHVLRLSRFQIAVSAYFRSELLQLRRKTVLSWEAGRCARSGVQRLLNGQSLAQVLVFFRLAQRLQVLQYAQKVDGLQICRELDGDCLRVLLRVYQGYGPECVLELHFLLAEFDCQSLHGAVQSLCAYRVFEDNEPEVYEHGLLSGVVRNEHFRGGCSELADIAFCPWNPVEEPGNCNVWFKLVPNSSVVVHVEALREVVLDLLVDLTGTAAVLEHTLHCQRLPQLNSNVLIQVTSQSVVVPDVLLYGLHGEVVLLQFWFTFYHVQKQHLVYDKFHLLV